MYIYIYIIKKSLKSNFYKLNRIKPHKVFFLFNFDFNPNFKIKKRERIISTSLHK